MSPELVSRVPVSRVWRGAVIAAAAATAAVELYAAAVRALGVPMKAGFLGAATASPLTAASFATGVLVCTFWGAVLATVLARKAAQPARRFVALAAALTGRRSRPWRAGPVSTAPYLWSSRPARARPRQLPR
jgi:hypothetical protein